MIDGVSYAVEFAGSEFVLYVDVARSTRPVYRFTEMERGFWDGPPATLWLRSPELSTRHILQIRGQVLGFIQGILRSRRPYYFEFRANEVSTFPAYRALARRLARDFGYDFSEEDGIFRFTRSAAVPEAVAVAPSA